MITSASMEPPAQDERRHGCWDCAHMYDLGGTWVCCADRDERGMDGELLGCTAIREQVCMGLGSDWEEA